MKNIRGKIGDDVCDFIQCMNTLKIDDCVEGDVYTNVADATMHGVRGILRISISQQVQDNLKNK